MVRAAVGLINGVRYSTKTRRAIRLRVAERFNDLTDAELRKHSVAEWLRNQGYEGAPQNDFGYSYRTTDSTENRARR
jgi:hypothetical protein